MLCTTVPIPAAVASVRRPPLIGLGLLVSAFAATVAAAAEPTAPVGDPVAALRDLLKQGAGPDLAAREGKITELLDKMDLEELSRVLLLQEWRPPEQAGLTEAERKRADDDLEARTKARAEVASRFRQKALDMMATPAGATAQSRAASLLIKAATADLIGETAAAGRKLDYLAAISETRPGARTRRGEIGYLAQKLSDLTPALIQMTAQTSAAGAASEQARLSAARALGEIQPAEPGKVVDALEKLLADRKSSPGLRVAAAESMDRLAQAAAEDMQRSLGLDEGVQTRFTEFARAIWLAVLRQGLAKDQPVEVRRLSISAFARIAAEMLDISVIPEPRSPIRELLLDPAIAKQIEEEANRGFQRLAEVFAVYEKHSGALADAVRDEDAEVHAAALSALVDLANIRQRLHNLATGVTPEGTAPPAPVPPGAGDKGAKPQASASLGAALALIAADEPPPQQKSQKQAYDDLTKGMAQGLDSVVKQLAAPDAAMRRAAIDVLEVSGDGAFPAVGAITKALGDRDRFVRWAAARTLGQLAAMDKDGTRITAQQAEAAVQGITVLLHDEDLAPGEFPNGVRLAAAAALEQFGPRAASAAPLLTLVINRSQTDAALRLVPTRDTEPDLVTGDPSIRVAAMHALEAINDEQTVKALGAAEVALGDGNAHVRQAAAAMIGRVGPKASAEDRARLVGALGQALADPDGDVRRAASGALVRLLPQKPK
jgi:hypothetical protein